jgi:alpha-amylase/alpha-mannosidase (GH57 family)
VKKKTCPDICLAIVWHQHQPYYWELASKQLFFPWVRLHATKDYVDMAARLEDFPEVHQTFNLVPSLLEQIEAYGSGEVSDRYLDIARIPANELSDVEKTFLLERFFDAQEDNLIRPHARYAALKNLVDSKGIETARREMTDRDFLDLQTWFNLAWIDPWIRDGDEFLQGLVKQGEGFSEEEKGRVLEKHMGLLAEVIPVHRRLQEKGTIEVTTTPFFHPILPLLCDTNAAKIAMPGATMPNRRFQHPEDAREQVRRAVKFYEERFGKRPRGMWPAEGSVSPEAAALFAEAGVEWIASDEEVLGKSLDVHLKRRDDGTLTDARTLYTPYRYESEKGEIAVLFRDHVLSDLIGFQYRWSDPGDAAADFVRRIERAAKECGKSESDGPPPLVPVILDGENCWEFYHNDGHPFLEDLYGRLTDHPSIRCVSVSEYLDEYRESGKNLPELPNLYSGSWINHNFSIWIGHEEDNRSWDLLEETRRDLVSAAGDGQDSDKDLEKAWKELYIAEGSDWNWWYGGEHYTAFAETFDRLYRQHLQNVYRFIGREPPGSLGYPIHVGRRPKVAQVPLRMMTPVVDGRVTDYFEWCEAGRFTTTEAGDAMHAGESRIRWVYFGFDLDHFFVRVDFRKKEDRPGDGEEMAVLFSTQEERRVVATTDGTARVERRTDGDWEEDSGEIETAFDSIWEVAIPWMAVPSLKEGDSFPFAVQILKNGNAVERVPREAALDTVRPTPDYDEEMWVV